MTYRYFAEKILSTLTTISLIIFLSNCSKSNKETQPVKEKPNQFGLSVNGLTEVCDTIDVGQTLSDLLLPHNVSQSKINEIEKTAANIFSTRNFRPDDELYIYSKQDSVESVKYFVYVQDPINYIVFDLYDSIAVYKKQKPVTVKQIMASGTITSSLTKTFQDKNIDLRLAYKLADIYECEIDFFHIKQNDSFKVYYEQMYVDDQPVGVGKILAASFNYHKENFYAFYFDKEKDGDYWDEKGNSLRRGFLKAPLKFSHITSRYSMNRFHPILHRNKAHLGTDFAAPTGTPIMATAAGVVIAASYTGGNGNYVKIKHNKLYSTQYLHMSKFAKGIHAGVAVKQGQVIGYVGSTGLATGPHVCYRFWKNGKQVDPMREKNFVTNPISKKNKAEFNVVLNEWMKKLVNENEAALAQSTKDVKPHS